PAAGVGIGPAVARVGVQVVERRLDHTRVEQQALDTVAPPGAALVGRLAVDPEVLAADLDAGRASHQPFTAPALIPRMNCSESSTYSRTIGAIEMTRPAARPPTSRKFSPTQWNDASGTVASSGLVTS